MSTRGFLYIASGAKYVSEAIESVTSLKNYCPDLTVAIYTDKDNISLATDHFDIVRSMKRVSFNFIDKIEPLQDSPFDQTIFLDTDTYICEDISALFPLLDKYDFLACFAPNRSTTKLDIPDFFPEFNTGVIGFSNTEPCKDVLMRWLEHYVRQINESPPPPHDQPALREALYDSKATVYVLPNEFNFRITNPNVLWKHGTVKIIHGRHNCYSRLVRLLNQDTDGIRLFYNEKRFLKGNTLKFFDAGRNKLSIPIKVAFWITGWVYKLKFRLLGDSSPQKKKGN